jgi:hypothetical protein
LVLRLLPLLRRSPDNFCPIQLRNITTPRNS